MELIARMIEDNTNQNDEQKIAGSFNKYCTGIVKNPIKILVLNVKRCTT